MLWARVLDETEGGTPRCPVSSGAKARAVERQGACVSATGAKSDFGLTPSYIKRLPKKEGLVRSFGGGYGAWAFIFGEEAGGGGMQPGTVYPVAAVKAVAREL